MFRSLLASWLCSTPRSRILAHLRKTCAVALVACGTTLLLVMASADAATTTTTPLVLYTDIVSGPNSGCENNQGIYLSIFGMNFGSTGLGTTTRVKIGGIEVGGYRRGLDPASLTPLAAGVIGASKGRPDVQQITVQVGTLAGLSVGVPYPVTVEVDGVASNADKTFTILPGNIYFVSLTGNDNAAGSYSAPLRHVQLAAGVQNGFAICAAASCGAFGLVRAGDFIVMRGGTWSDKVLSGNGTDFLSVQGKSGCPIGDNCAQGGGTSSGAITLMAYPGEDVYVNMPYDGTFGGGIRSADSARQEAGYGAWINVSGLRIESGYREGVISVESGSVNPLGSNWRIVNNELTAASAVGDVEARGGGVSGNGAGGFWVGNHIHDVYCGPDDGTSQLQNHGFYIDADGTFEIAYNVVNNIFGGNGFQSYVNGSNGTDTTSHINLHHNLIHDVGKHGINIGDGTADNVRVWNNVVYNTAFSGLRFNTTDLSGMLVYNNTFYNTFQRGAAGGNTLYSVVSNDWSLANGAVSFVNNIFYAGAATGYLGGSSGFETSGSTDVVNWSHNLWYNGTDTDDPAAFDASPVVGNPAFANAAGANFQLTSGSMAVNAGSAAVAALVTNDYTVLASRPQGAAYDIGAFELPSSPPPILTPQAITHFVSNPSIGAVGGDATLSATGGGSGNTVTFGGGTSDVCTVSGNSVHFSGVGTCVVTADQAGNASYSAAPQITLNIRVWSVQVAICFTALFDKTLGDPPFAVSASASSGLGVSFSSLTGAVCTVTGNTVALVSAGICTIRASQVGNATYAAVAPVDQSFTVSNAPGAYPIAVPTLSQWAMTLLAGLIGLIGLRNGKNHDVKA